MKLVVLNHSKKVNLLLDLARARTLADYLNDIRDGSVTFHPLFVSVVIGDKKHFIVNNGSINGGEYNLVMDHISGMDADNRLLATGPFDVYADLASRVLRVRICDETPVG